MRITTKEGTFDLASDFTIQIDEKSPITNDIGSQSVPVTIPCTPKNARITGHAQRVDLGTKTMTGGKSCVIQDGVYIRQGTLNIVSASRSEGITLNIGFDNAEAYSKWKERPLAKLASLPEITFENVNALCTHLDTVMRGEAEDPDYAVFTIKVENQSGTLNNTETPCPIYLNRVSSGSLNYRWGSSYTVVNGTVYRVNVPQGYGVTPFLYIWRILELVFADFGYTLEENPFKTDSELASLVVLNNAADSCCTPTLHYADLMPSCTVEEFLKSLYARFGAVYTVSTDTRQARIRLIRDIIRLQAERDYTDKMVGFPLITYSEPRQLKLTSKNSLEGAATETERYEDFVKDGILTGYYTNHIVEETQNGLQFLNQELVTGRWYRWTKEGNTVIQKIVSSSFFAWDRQEKDVAYEEVTAEDESVPMTIEMLDGQQALMPLYLKGCIHRYTTIRFSDDNRKDENNNETPLAFLIAFKFGSMMAGSSFPYRIDGTQITINGKPFSFQLTWQFTNGLFKRFWASYDSILRHANIQVEADTIQPLHEIAVDFLAPVTMNGQRMLVDSISYMLPSNGPVKVAMTFKTLRLIGPYNTSTEQAIIGYQNLAFSLYWEFTGTDADTIVNNIAQSFKDEIMSGDGVYIYSTESSWVYTNGLGPDTDQDIITNSPNYYGQTMSKTYHVNASIKIVYARRQGGMDTLWREPSNIAVTANFVSRRAG